MIWGGGLQSQEISKGWPKIPAPLAACRRLTCWSAAVSSSTSLSSSTHCGWSATQPRSAVNPQKSSARGWRGAKIPVGSAAF